MRRGIATTLLAARLAAAALPLPTAPQLRWQSGSGIMALIHFNMATFFQDGDPGCTSANWLGETGSGNPNSFAPSDLNVSQWVDSMVAIGVDEAVLTAKHGCGFYLWPTKVKLPDGSPYTYHVNVTAYGDVLAQFRDATSARGIGHGFYYSLTNNRFLNVYGHSVQPGPLQPGQDRPHLVAGHQPVLLPPGQGLLPDLAVVPARFLVFDPFGQEPLQHGRPTEPLAHQQQQGHHQGCHGGRRRQPGQVVAQGLV